MRRPPACVVVVQKDDLIEPTLAMMYNAAMKAAR
jgi:hypothetical protein